MTAFLLSLALQIAPPEKPAAAYDPASAKSVVEHVSYNTRTTKSYEATWKGRLAVPRSDPLDYTGRCVWVRPGVLYSHYTASGGDDKKIVLAGPGRAWVYHSLVGWVTADEAGIPGAGRGIQNPDEALAVLSKNPAGAKLVEPGVVELAFEGADIERIMKEQAQQGAFDWKKSKAVLRLTSDDQRRLKTLVCKATLVSSDPKVQGEVTYDATIDVQGYDQATELAFTDEKKKAIPLSKKIAEQIQNVLKETP
ncbi:MAG TPA: hypothetical protein VF950_12640 [Planctomycetota bacterium]